MSASQRPLSWRPDRTFVASNAEVDPLWFVEVASAALTIRQRLVLVAGALDWESYAVAGPGVPTGAPLTLGALVPPEDVRLLQRLWAERPELAVRWLAEIDQEERTHRAHALLEVMARDAGIPGAEGHGGGG
jgi:hypothetical protein